MAIFQNEKPMNDFNFGAMVTKYTNCFAEDLPESDKMKSIID
jgi:hypothetical protein